MDGQQWVALWKVISILMTGAFGIVGLLTDFKRKETNEQTGQRDNKITKWGWLSLCGILISTICGVYFQHKSDRLDAERAIRANQESEELLRTTKAALKGASESLVQIERSMTTIESVTVTFEVACSGALAKFCRTRDFSAWPFSYDKTAFQFNVFFYKDRASDTKREAPSDGDLRYMFIVSSDRPVQTIPMSSSVYIEIESPGSAFIHHSLGNLRAKQDFLNARVAVNQIVSREDLIRTLPISVVWVRLRFRDGEDVYVSDSQKFFNLKGDSQDWGFESLWAAVVERAQGSANSSTRRRILRL